MKSEAIAKAGRIKHTVGTRIDGRISDNII